jgi:phosphomannomutase
MKFGTSGLRGLVTDMTDAACARWTAAFMAYLVADGSQPETVLVGRDLRPSSPRIAAAVRGAIRAAGATAVDCGVLPTPALALEAAQAGVPAIMVTGSHIPFDRNGIKFYRAEGEITKADETGILEALDATPRTVMPGHERIDDRARTRYLERGSAFFGADALSGLRIGVYQHSAAGRDLMAEALSACGATAIPLGRSDDFIPIDTEAVRPEDERLAETWVAEHNLDALVTTDGDGDRPLIADETGCFLRGDLVGLLTARLLGADAVATPVSSNTALERSGWVAHIARTRIGSPYVIEALGTLAAEGARCPVGYEANGGFLLGAAIDRSGRLLAALPTRDAMLPILTLLSATVAQNMPLSSLVAEAPPRVTASDRLEAIPSIQSSGLLSELARDTTTLARFAAGIGASDVMSVNTLDGVRITLRTDEIVHLRASGNAPELRCYAESHSAARAKALVQAGLATARTMLAPAPPADKL